MPRSFLVELTKDYAQRRNFVAKKEETISNLSIKITILISLFKMKQMRLMVKLIVIVVAIDTTHIKLTVVSNVITMVGFTKSDERWPSIGGVQIFSTSRVLRFVVVLYCCS